MLISNGIIQSRLVNEMVPFLGARMGDKQDNGWFSGIDRWLDKQAEKRIEKYIDQYAKNDDGTIDEKLARRISWEVGRRGETGKQLDIYEPLRWTGIRAVLGVLGAAGAKLIEARWKNQTDKKYFHFIEIGLIAGTAISSAIDLMRLFPRWLSGLEGGKNTALKLHREFIAPPNDQAFTPPPVDKVHEPRLSSVVRGITRQPPVQPTSLMQQAERSDSAPTIH